MKMNLSLDKSIVYISWYCMTFRRRKNEQTTIRTIFHSLHFVFLFLMTFFLSILLRVGMVERGAAGWFRDRYQDLLWWRRTEEQQTLPFPPRHSQSCCCGSGQLSGRTYSRDSTVSCGQWSYLRVTMFVTPAGRWHTSWDWPGAWAEGWRWRLRIPLIMIVTL